MINITENIKAWRFKFMKINPFLRTRTQENFKNRKDLQLLEKQEILIIINFLILNLVDQKITT